MRSYRRSGRSLPGSVAHRHHDADRTLDLLAVDRSDINLGLARPAEPGEAPRASTREHRCRRACPRAVGDRGRYPQNGEKALDVGTGTVHRVKREMLAVAA
jgi:hypothetical protein